MHHFNQCHRDGKCKNGDRTDSGYRQQVLLLTRVLLLTLPLSLTTAMSGCSTLAQSSGTTSSKQAPSAKQAHVHATTQKVQSQEPMANEGLLEAAENYAGLIELYKSRMQQGKSAEQEQARLKLAEVYLQTDDPESALFTIEPLFAINPLLTVKPLSGNAKPSDNNTTVTSWLLKSKALFALGDLEQAMVTAKQAQSDANATSPVHPLSPRIMNHIGLIHVAYGQYKEARTAFNEARHAMLDDLTVKNNLAMLDILEYDYKSAIGRLMPLYTTGQADEQIKANLAIALARAGHYQDFKALIAQGQPESETATLFMTLSKVPILSQASTVKKAGD